jgi:hypothetical protein
MRVVVALLTLVLALWCPSSSDAQIYRWVDERGVPHYAEGIDSVPDRYRATAVPLGMRNAPPSGPIGSSEGKAAASGTTTIKFPPGQRIMVDVTINGSGEAILMLDTGADRTLISPRALQAAGVQISAPVASGQIMGATGSERIQFVVVESLAVGEAKVGRMPVGAHNLPTTDVGDGLLGRDFLDQFKVSIDSAKGTVTLSPK